MGCFSWLCKKCGKGIQSSSLDGQECHLFLLRDGKVLQKMSGQYDSYGRVFKKGNQGSVYWKDPTPEIPLKSCWQEKDGGPSNPENHGYWLRVCDLLHGDKLGTGMAAFHAECYDGVVPTTQSEDDPNQGWGEYDEDD